MYFRLRMYLIHSGLWNQIAGESKDTRSGSKGNQKPLAMIGLHVKGLLLLMFMLAVYKTSTPVSMA